MFVYRLNEKRLAAVNFDHAVRFDVIMTLAFFNNLHLNHGCLFQSENIQFHLVAIRPNSSKNTTILAVIVYLHSQTQCFFVDVSFKFSNTRCRYTAYGNLAILLTLKQCVTGYLLTLQEFVFFDVLLDINGQVHQKVHDTKAKRFLILSCLPFSFRKRILVLNIFSAIM